MSKEYAALVTGPINKKIINDYGFEFSGHTEFLADISQTKDVVMLLANSKSKNRFVDYSYSSKQSK